jgi:hypothetical protein
MWIVSNSNFSGALPMVRASLISQPVPTWHSGKRLLRPELIQGSDDCPASLKE